MAAAITGLTRRVRNVLTPAIPATAADTVPI
jgi:hypothetical protein